MAAYVHAATRGSVVPLLLRMDLRSPGPHWWGGSVRALGALARLVLVVCCKSPAAAAAAAAAAADTTHAHACTHRAASGAA